VALGILLASSKKHLSVQAMIKNYLKTAWRNILTKRSTSFINISGLAVGMAVALLIGLWINDELSFNKIQ
jgi:hypothetical protein